MGEEGGGEGEGGTLLGLPELDTEVDVSVAIYHPQILSLSLYSRT